MGVVYPSAATGQFKEYEVKAVFLYNLTNFIAWPEDAFNSPKDAFVIGIFGEDPFGPILDRLVKDEIVAGTHPIVVKRAADINELKPCHLLFISADAEDQWSQIFSMLESKSTLTVADTENFAHSGGMVNLTRNNNRIEIEINAELTRKSGLEVSAKLLDLCTIVEP